MPSTSNWADQLPLKIVNVLVFAFLFSANIYSSFKSYGRETYFTPAAPVFKTWTLIDILLLGFVIYQFFDASNEGVRLVGWRFAIVGVLNAIFVHVFVSNHLIVAFIFACLVAASVSTVYYSLAAHHHQRSIGDTLFVHLPFSLWHAWSIVLVLISGFALFTHGHHKAHPSVLSRIAVVAAEAFLTLTAIGYAFRSREGDVAGSIVLTWTLYGIYQHQRDDVIRYAALAGFILSLIAVLKSLYFTFVSRDRGVSLGNDDERRPLVA
ncbi:hypothetical protein BMF94_5348 [Rhodotorula taiwanensis]|uniref:Uncharacterized protein n=1 Tax=Rhodotorula taiwanensis TaxID=741276 RepID=A0A2S5B4E4_9BASI|nr:hypothetical protein BMF94_5348 [Rhodotorula taiwanensis]